MTVSIVCTFCSSEFSTNVQKHNALCPYCGCAISNEIRIHIREPFEEKCKVSNGFGSISGVTIDTSISGAGIKVFSPTLPFNKNDMIDFAFDVDEEKLSTQVMWFNQVDGNSSHVGLRFNRPVQET